MKGVDEVGVENWRIEWAPPPRRTYLPAAASRAHSSTVAGSASTKWNVVSPSVNKGPQVVSHHEDRRVERLRELRVDDPPQLVAW